MVRPVDNKWPITQHFGANAHWPWQLGYGHLGEDYGCPIGTQVYAIQNGTVIFADWGIKMSRSMAARYAFIFGSPDSGIVTVIEYDDKTVGIAAHLDETKLNARQRVKTGQVIGLSGTTGRSTGPHVHQECMLESLMGNGRYGRINPSSYWPKFSIPAPVPPLTPTQRRVLAGGVNELTAPNTKTGKVKNTYAGGAVLNFKGFIRGETVDGSYYWLVGKSGGYFHNKRFTQTAVRGLPDLTPKPALLPKVLKTKGFNVTARRSPYLLRGNVAVTVRPNSTVVCSGYTDQGDLVNGTRIWYKTAVSGYWIHASLFTTQPTGQMKKIAPPNR